MQKYKTFIPKVDIKKRLVLTRFYCGIKNNNCFMYTIHNITLNNTISIPFNHLFCLSNDDYNSVNEFYNSKTGDPVEVLKTDFKSVLGTDDNNNILEVWSRAVYLHIIGNGNEIF